MADNCSLCSYDSLTGLHYNHLHVHYSLFPCSILHNPITLFSAKKNKSRKVNFVRGCDVLIKEKHTHAHTHPEVVINGMAKV